jgi:hypothetical protein
MPYNFKDKKKASEAGQKGKPGKHEKTKQWEALAESIVNIHAARFNEVLTKLPDKDFANVYIIVLNYFKPKQQTTQLNIESERPIIQLINVSKSFNQLDGFTINDSVSPDKEIKEEN